MFLSLLFYSFNLFNLPKPVKDMIKICLVFSFFQKYTWFSGLLEITATKILIVFRMNEKHNIMIFYALFIWLHFELIVKYKSEYSLLNVLVDDFKSTCNRKINNSTRTNLLILTISFYVVIISYVMRVFYLRVFYESFIYVFFEVHFSKKLFIDKHSLKAVRHITLSFTMINSKGSVYTDFISFFFVGSVWSKHEYILFWEFLSKFDFECTDTWWCTVDWAAHIILGVNMLKYDFITKRDVLSSFFWDHGFKLFLFGFSTLKLFFLSFFVHLVIDLERGSGKYFK